MASYSQKIKEASCIARRGSQTSKRNTEGDDESPSRLQCGFKKSLKKDHD